LSRLGKKICMAPDCQVMVVKGMKGVVWSKETRTGNDRIHVTACSKRCYRDVENHFESPHGMTADGLTFGAVAEYWIENKSMYLKGTKKLCSEQHRVDSVRQCTWWIDRIGDVRLDRLNEDLVENHFGDIDKARAAKTVHKYKLVLGHVLESARKRRLYAGPNFAETLTVTRDDETQLVPLRDGEDMGKSLWVEDIEQLKEQFPVDSFLDWNTYVAAMIAIHAGLRAGEISGLKQNHVLRNEDGAVERLRIEGGIKLLAKADKETGIPAVWGPDPSTKGKRARTVGIHDSQFMTELLDENQVRQAEFRRAIGSSSVYRGYVVTDINGDFYNPSGYSSNWSDRCLLLEPPIGWDRPGSSNDDGVRTRSFKAPKFHDLRHTFSYFGIRKGMTITEMMNALGHTKASTTDHYLRSNMVLDQQEVVSKIGGTALTG